ncbi:MAG: repressor LexA [Chthoniobacter sp.]|jgi:repressor LexA|nr:repressor LexA [Chthoniobacter sp.]
MAPLTKRQKEILDFIDRVQTRSGVMPSTREIQEHFGFASQTAAVNHLRALERKGVIQRQAGKARAMVLVSNLRRQKIIDIPLYGQIAAGMAEATDQQDEGMISVDAESIGIGRGKRVFALKVRGESMIDAGISDGDLVVLEIKEPRPGDVVAALIDGETTLKRYLSTHGRPVLKAENPAFPNLVPVGELLIQGVMVALIRKYRR